MRTLQPIVTQFAVGAADRAVADSSRPAAKCLSAKRGIGVASVAGDIDLAFSLEKPVNLNKLLAPAAAAAVLALAPALSHAALMVQITDGTDTITIADGSAQDMNARVGGVAYMGSLGAWSFNTAVGTGNDNPLSMHLIAGVEGGSSGGLWINLTYTDLDAAADPMPFYLAGGGSGATGAQVSWAGYVDDGNNAFGMSELIFGANTYNAAGSGSAQLNGTYSATISTYFDYSGVSYPHVDGSSLDIHLIPEPTTLALIGLGLVGLGATRRRKA